MFTGIIEALGFVREIKNAGTNKTFWVESPISHHFKIDQSISHDGVCLTVEEIKEGSHRVTAVLETLEKTNLNGWKPADKLNLERCLPMNGRLDGHMVQGHVDAVANLVEKKNLDGSWLLTFSYPTTFAPLLVEKGSIALNGISLTIFNLTNSLFTVAIIPFTYDHTNIQDLQVNDIVNLEFDMIGKYVNRFMKHYNQQA